MKAVILKWIPWCGKSTYAKSLEWYKHINRDILREENPELKEYAIAGLEAKLINDSVWQNIVVDNTHINPESLQRVIDLCTKAWYEVEVVDVFELLIKWPKDLQHYDEDLNKAALFECIWRNSQRVWKKKVPVSVIYEMYLKAWFSLTDKKIIICDLDGTLYDIRHRLHYLHSWKHNRSKFESEEEISKDAIVPQIKEIIHLLSHKYQIIFLSWRRNTMCDVTISNLARDGIISMPILMRNSWDWRKDYDVKKDFLYLLLQKHKIHMAIDDRKQVVDLWKENGIYVLNACQLEDNNF